MAVQTKQAVAATSRAEQIVAWLLPSLADLVFVALLMGVLFGLQGKILGYDGDSAWHIRIGEYTLAHGLPRTEVLLGTTLGQPHIYYEWLGQVAYGLAHRFYGLNGVVALASLLVALAGAGLLLALRRRGMPALPALLLMLLALPLTTVTWTARAQLFTLVLALWWSEQLWRYRRDGKPWRLWALPPVLALWANLHAGFIVGLVLLATTTLVLWLAPSARLAARPRDLALTLGACLLATLATPWGLALPEHIFGFLSDPLISRYTAEFQSPDFHTALPLLFLALAAGLVGLWIWLAASGERAAPDPLALAHAVVWTTLALYSVRYIAIWALVVVPMLAEALLIAAPRWRNAARHQAGSPSVESYTARMTAALHTTLDRLGALSMRLDATDALVGKGIWSGLALVLVGLTLARGGVLPGGTAAALDARYDPRAFPVEAVARLQQSGTPPGVGFTTYTWGGYLDYALPEHHAFIDSRSDEYSETLLADYLTLTHLGSGWRQVLDRYTIAWALIPPGEPLATALPLLPGWKCAAADSAGVALLCARESTAAHTAARGS